MTSKQNPPQLIAIGGLGGSGTRVVAQILQKMGFYLGPVLNPQLDNLLFTLLFKRRDWFETFPTDTQVDHMIGTFTTAMLRGGECAFNKLTPGEIKELAERTLGLGVSPQNLETILTSDAPDLKAFSGLAWKEPNTHVFLPQLVRRLPNLKYIHVIRNGLDMALSKNLQQLNNWGKHYGVPADVIETLPSAQLKFWLNANLRIIDFSHKMTSEQFILLNYDDLCLDFTSEVTHLQSFLGRQLSDTDMTELSRYVSAASIGRFRQAPANTFSSEDRKAVQQLGFCVD